MNEAAAGRVATVPRSGATPLTEGRASLDAVLRSAVDRMAPATRRVVGYHLGQLDDQGAAVDLNPGKAIRSALVLLSAQVDHLSSFGLQLGLAYQLVDDLLGIWGEPEVTGKPARSDLQSRKKTFPVVAALVSQTSAGRALADLYRREAPLSEAELARAAHLIVEAGGRDWSETQLHALVAHALHDLELARLTEPAGTELRSLAHRLARRDR